MIRVLYKEILLRVFGGGGGGNWRQVLLHCLVNT
jgi:hypothetical protein